MVHAKICGLTNAPDALLAEQLGAHALGFICVQGTKRYLEPAAIATISQQLGPMVAKVGVFMNATQEHILQVMAQAKLNTVQLHGQEPPELAEALREYYPVIKAITLEGEASSSWLQYPADALLVDGKNPGSGESYPKSWIEPLLQHPRLIVAGGLNPHNLAGALALAPYGVDVSSGVEQAIRVKSPELLEGFLRQVHQHNALLASAGK